MQGYIDSMDASYHLKERFTVMELVELGWSITKQGRGVAIEKKEVSYYAHPWPIDPFGTVADDKRERIGEQGRPTRLFVQSRLVVNLLYK